MRKTIKYLVQMMMILGLSLALFYPVFAEDMPEDGEKQVREQLQKEKEETPLLMRVQNYLASGVHANVYQSAQIQGVDVSYHQGTIDWAKVKSSGMQFAMIRVGYRGYGTGKICKDVMFETNVQNALAAGMKVGIYFFSQALNEQEAYEEAIYTVQQIQKYNIAYPVVFDWETSSGYRTYSAGLSSTQMNAMAKKFCDTVASYGYTPMVYSNTTDFKGRYGYSELASKYYIWYARYLPEYGGTTWYKPGNRLPNYDNNIEFNMWQYMSDGTVPGIGGNCDVNVTFLDFATKKPPQVVNVKVSTTSKDLLLQHEDAIIAGIKPGMTCGELRAVFPDFYVGLNYGSSSSDQNTVLKTGDVLHFATKSVYQKLEISSYQLAVTGDADGNGILSVNDMEAAQKHLLKIKSLDKVQQRALTVTGDTDVTVRHMEEIQKSLLRIR